MYQSLQRSRRSSSSSSSSSPSATSTPFSSSSLNPSSSSLPTTRSSLSSLTSCVIGENSLMAHINCLDQLQSIDTIDCSNNLDRIVYNPITTPLHQCDHILVKSQINSDSLIDIDHHRPQQHHRNYNLDRDHVHHCNCNRFHHISNPKKLFKIFPIMASLLLMASMMMFSSVCSFRINQTIDEQSFDYEEFENTDDNSIDTIGLLDQESTPSNSSLKNQDKYSCLTDQCMSISEKLHSSMDLEIDPCKNFYQFACGRWILEHPIPAHRNSWSQFELFALLIRNDLKKHLESKEKFSDKKLANIYKKLRQFYQGCIDTKQRNKNGYSELYRIIEELGGWPMLDGKKWTKTKEDSFHWERAYVTLVRLSIDYFIKFEKILDFRNTSKIIIKLGPPYQTSENIINLQSSSTTSAPKGEKIENKSAPDQTLNGPKRVYLGMLKELRQQREKNDSKQNQYDLDDRELLEDIEGVFKLQEKLETIVGPVYSMSYYQNYYEKHLMNISEIKSIVGFDIDYIIERIFLRNLTDDEMIFVPDINYLRALSPIMSQISKRVLANYFASNMVYQFGRHTTTTLIELLVSKLDAPEVISNICYQETVNYLPEILGKLYLDLYFDRKNRNDVKLIANLLRDSFRQLLKESKWMDEKTIGEAVKKLDAMSMNIGYPEWYNNDVAVEAYFKLYEEIDVNNYIGSVIRVNRAQERFRLEPLLEEQKFDFDAKLFSGWPQKSIFDVNAFYHFTSNGVYIPAGILRDAIFSSKLPGAITFGSIGMILGHEMTHAFDDNGKLYDEHGALRNWWTNQTRQLFSEKADCFVRQYSNYSINSAKINSHQTLSENIADNCGLREAYRAFKTYQSLNKEEKWRLPGSMSKFTADQLFFISFSHMWCVNMDQKAVESMVAYNVHSPPSIRVLGSLANFDQFSKAFGCPSGSPMNPHPKCVIW
ncbi:ABC transporter G family member 20-like [Sarcoptes scabiei]|nr:ABC transporter G family member 20-like [Sarcoptes scabiei]